ncbi:MAG: helix-turn-helix domain-containing protein [Candidatus Bathyarchaeota archaeon]|nr:helix-turn-helix domain-containing protein [Candidatus Bathyarchaeota archaeon]MDW8022860.1 helix-turn-helix domain-containing protein [Nitrososphaerota archaeon]MDW8041067.1 helix-turn-helix domain-containing protein [Nitrososphaerota archaeon]
MLPPLEEIAKRRKLLGLTQHQLARLAGVSQSFIAKIESGKIDPSYSKVKAIFDVLDRVETGENYTAKAIAHEGIIGVEKTDKVAKAIGLMMEHGFSQLPVFDRGKCVGCISEKTILSQVTATKDLSKVSQKLVEEIMEEAPPQIDENAPIPLISNLLRFYPAILVTRRGELVGIITKADLFKVVM